MGPCSPPSHHQLAQTDTRRAFGDLQPKEDSSGQEPGMPSRAAGAGDGDGAEMGSSTDAQRCVTAHEGCGGMTGGGGGTAAQGRWEHGLTEHQLGSGSFQHVCWACCLVTTGTPAPPEIEVRSRARAQNRLKVGCYQQPSVGGGQGHVSRLLMQAREPGLRNRAEQKRLLEDEAGREKNGWCVAA